MTKMSTLGYWLLAFDIGLGSLWLGLAILDAWQERWATCGLCAGLAALSVLNALALVKRLRAES